MTTAPEPWPLERWATVGVFSAAALLWGSLGVRAALGAEVAPRMLLACVAFTVLGSVVGVPVALLRRRVRELQEWACAMNTGLGLLMVAQGLGFALGADPGTGRVLMLALSSAVGGLLVSVSVPAAAGLRPSGGGGSTCERSSSEHCRHR